MEAGTISSWNVEVGSSFGAGDVICSVETDKATVDFEAQDEGVVARILIEAGSGEIKCGTPILITVQDVSDVSAFVDYVVEGATMAASAPAAVASPAPPPTTPAVPVAVSSSSSPSSSFPAVPPPAGTSTRVFASPRAHTLAKERGYGEISALRIVGTGPGGRIIAQDVMDYDPSSAAAASVIDAVAAAAVVVAPPTAIAAPPSAVAAPAAPAASSPPVVGPGYTDYALDAPALELASRLHSSKQNVPHYYLTIDLSLDALLEMRSTLNSAMKVADGKCGITVNDLLIKAAAAAMKTVPAANSSWLGDKIRVYDTVDINVVVGVGSSLYAPVIRDVGRRGLKAVSDDAASVVSVVEGGDPTSVPGFGDVGTFTMVNLGMFGVKSCAPIIREPQACALALGVIENRIVPNDDPKSDEIYKESVMMTATLSCDHRVVDGAVGAGWMSAFKNHVENPVTLLL
jgi:pyruvate dehydrogenase E2 component (dihydrolipoamide acetyltransferase)